MAKFRKFFELPYSPVGVKISRDSLEPDSRPARYCELVRKASLFGDEFVLTADRLTCAGAEVSLGFSEPMFDEVSPRLEFGTKAIIIKPLEKMKERPDAVIVIGTPKKLMRLSSVYNQIFGEPVLSQFKGSNAICGECTAVPILENRPNLSLLCDGCRTFADYKDDEIAVGMPYEVFLKIADGVQEDRIIRALCGCIMDDLPKNAVKAIADFGFDKATDHFFGFFNGQIIRMYAIKGEDGKVKELTFYLPVKFKNTEIAGGMYNKAREFFSEPYMIRLRDNWIDIVLPVDLFAPIQRVVQQKDKFESILNSAIDQITEKVKEFKERYANS